LPDQIITVELDETTKAETSADRIITKMAMVMTEDQETIKKINSF
jgi:hypothetical protein